MPAPINLGIELNHGQNPAYGLTIPVLLEARGAYDMRLSDTALPSGTWQAYDPKIEWTFPGPSGGSFILAAQFRHDDGVESAFVSGSIDIFAGKMGQPLDLMVDDSVFYTVKDILRGAGWIDENGADRVQVFSGGIEQFVPVEIEEGLDGGSSVPDLGDYDLDGDVTENVSAILPAIAILNNSDKYDPGAIGGADWEKRNYTIEVYGLTDGESREIAGHLSETLRRGLPVYDYGVMDPGISGFPLPSQYIGTFDVRSMSNSRVVLPSYSMLSANRRRLDFEIWNLRKSY